VKKGRIFAGKVLFLVSFLVLTGNYSIFSAPKRKEKKNKNSKATEQVVEETSTQPAEKEEGVKLPSSTKPRTYFYKIDDEIIAGVEDGSPDAIRNAVSKIKKTDGDYQDNEKVLIFVASSIMDIVWPSEKITWEKVEAPEDNPYSGAVKSARNGVFDSSTGNVDFLTTILPALVMLVPNTNQNIYTQCVDSIAAALEKNPESVLANYLAGVYFEKTENPIKAQDYYKKAYEKADNNLEIVLAYTSVLVTNKQSLEAKSVISRLNFTNPDDIRVLKQNAYIAFANKEYSSAENYVAKVLQQTPNDLEFLLFRAKIFIEKNDYIHAGSLLDMYARQNDTNIEYLILRTRVQLDWSKNTTAAAETIEKALRLYPSNEDALMLATRISSMTDSPVAGKYADELSAMVLEKNPDNKEALVYALEGLVQRENWQEAYVISSQLIKDEKNASNPEVIMQHVTVCIALNKKNEALDFATKAYSLNSQNETVIQAYVYAFSEVSDREASLSLINSLLNSSSSKMKSYLYYRRSFLQHSGDNELADLRASLIANPRNSEALFRMYEIYYSKEDYRKAQYYLRQVVAINPNDSTTRKLNEALTQLIK